MNGTLINTEPVTAASSEWISPVPGPLPALMTQQDVETKSGNFAGLNWVYRVIAEDLLRTTPVRAWQEPDSQKWERVKVNPARSVWRASINGHTYFLKYYTQDDWRSRLKKALRGPICAIEFNNGLYALKAGVPTVPTIAYCSSLRYQGHDCSLLITQALEPVYPLNEYWDLLQGDENAERCRRDRQVLIDLLAEMIAKAHQAGFEHRDMHAANILVHPLGRRRYETAFVDLQSIHVGRSLDDWAVVENLGLLNQWFRRHAGICDRLRFLRRYLRWRNEYEQSFKPARALGMTFDGLVYALSDNASRHADWLWSKRDRRIRRSGKYFSKLRLSGGWRGHVFLQSKRPSPESSATSMILSRDWWKSQLQTPLELLEQGGGRACKNSHSARVARAVLKTESGPLQVIVKRPLARNWRRRLRMILAPSRGMRGWSTGYALLNRDIPAARPLAVLERRLGPFILDNVLITEAIAGGLDFDVHLERARAERNDIEWRRHKLELSALLVRQLRLLAERRFIHRDCKAQNVLVAMQPQLRLFWIDMDGLRRVRHVTFKDEMRALARLHVSLLNSPGITRTDRIRFLKMYLARFGADAGAWRQVVRKIDRATSVKLNIKWVRRRWKVRHYGRE